MSGADQHFVSARVFGVATRVDGDEFAGAAEAFADEFDPAGHHGPPAEEDENP